MELKISNDQLELVRAILKKHVPELTVWCFGSRVRGDNRAFSDLDLVIKGNEALKFEILTSLRADFDESNLPFKVDISDWRSLDPDFQKIITAEHAVICGV